MKTKLGILTLVLISLLVLSGCKTGEPTLETNPADGISTGYPAPQLPVQAATSAGYPAPGTDHSPAGAPVRENASLVQVEILSLTPSEKNAEYVVLHVRVITAAPAEGLEEYNPNLPGQEIDILVLAGDATSLEPGKIIDLTIRYSGDEWGGGYYGSNITTNN